MFTPRQTSLIAYLLMFAIATTPICVGVEISGTTFTPTTCAMALAALLISYIRFANVLPLLPLRIFFEPAVITPILYFAVGITTGFVATDHARFLREIVQRTTIVWLPFYCYSMGPRRLKDVKSMLLWFVATTTILALVSSGTAISGKFKTPAYVLGLHKNATASLLASMAIICIAYLASSKRKTVTLLKRTIRTKVLYGSLTGLSMLGIVASQGRAGLVEVLVATYMMLIAIRAKPSTLVKIAVVVIVGCVVIFKALPEQAIEHVVSTKQHSANAVRLELWGVMWHQFQANPFTCVGWGNAFVDEKGYSYYDLACVLLFDWMQMSVVGAIALVLMMAASIMLGMNVARRCNPHSIEGFISLSALGIIAGKVVHSMLDTFWIARGGNMHPWMAVGIALFLKLWLDQRDQNRRAATQSRVLVRT